MIIALALDAGVGFISVASQEWLVIVQGLATITLKQNKT